MFENSKVITKEVLLLNIGEKEIFKKYLGLRDIEEEVLILNPLRADSNPTCSFKFVNDRIQFRDWSESFSRDCFNVAQLVTRSPTFHDTLVRIAKDFGLLKMDGKEHFISVEEGVKRVKKEAVKLEIRVLFKDWEALEVEFWKQFGISKQTCIDFNVYPIRKAWVGESAEPFYEFKYSDIGFAFYYGKGDYKLYFPLRERFRFLHNNSKVIQGVFMLPKIGKYCVLTKSYKDVMAFYELGVVAVAPMSETVIITPEQYAFLSSRFLKVFILNDNDWPGKKATIRTLKQYPDLIPLLFEKGEPKDFTDNIKVYGVEDMRQMVEHYKNILL